ncbi:energy transducer TonB [Aureibaculum sp. A20]|uniref:Energy transducer TonB n=1 Tax=Aureibaculum flavum TaxID=2795986 RepID=A0ABS0WP54_9FLAO|nr:energy transducer TonB [Aureibaculum flavum]MBJ2173760.1 energy transducer TonB [Aureibaculum flavum]
MIRIFICTLFTFSSLLLFSQEIEVVNGSDEGEEVPFAIIEDVPTFPGCEELEKHLQKNCFQTKILKHVVKNFDANLANELGLPSGKTRIVVMFTIASEGVVTDIRARGAHERLELEGIRVINALPKMKPGKLKGRPVNVKYTLPITLLVEKTTKNEETKEEVINKN